MAKGFTLLELVIVIVIVAVLAIIVVPRIMDITDARLHMASEKLAADLRYAHEFAMSHNKRTKVSFNTGSSSYTVYYEESPGSWSIAEEPRTRENFEVFFNQGDYTGVTVDSVGFDGTGDVIFDSLGRPYDADGDPLSGGGVLLEAASGRRTIVLVDAVTGRIYVGSVYESG